MQTLMSQLQDSNLRQSVMQYINQTANGLDKDANAHVSIARLQLAPVRHAVHQPDCQRFGQGCQRSCLNCKTPTCASPSCSTSTRLPTVWTRMPTLMSQLQDSNLRQSVMQYINQTANGLDKDAN